MNPTTLIHRTVLLAEAVDGLSVKPDGIYVDCTFGRGGHSRRILEQLGPDGRLIAFDKDPAAIASAQALADPRFQIVHEGFVCFTQALDALGVSEVDGVLMEKMPGQIGQLAKGIEGMQADKSVARIEGIINSMTPAERRKPELIKANRKRRIAAGSGVTVQEVNRLLAQFEQTQKMMKQFSKGGLSKLMRGMKGMMPGGGM